jgi:hypothetical protein
MAEPDQAPVSARLEAPERVSRDRLELVIRRAAELYAREADTGDMLTEDEVLRIAEELGLPARLARQAMFELPAGEPAPRSGGFVARLLGKADIVAVRAIAAPEGSVEKAIREQLIKREYLSVVRDRAGRLKLAPAADMASAIARGFKRSSKRHLVGRAESVDVALRALDDASAHVMVDVDLSNKRRDYIAGGVAGGVALGGTIGAGAFAAVAAALGGIGAPEVALAASGAGLVGFAAGMGAAFKMAAASFRKRLRGAATELEGLLDRVEAAASKRRIRGPN